MSKLKSAQEIANLISDGDTVAVTGSGGGLLEPDGVLAAIEQRFLSTGHPKNITLVHALGIGDSGSRGVNRLAYKGLVKRVIGGHWSWSQKMQKLAENEEIEAYALPAGVITQLMRASGAKRPGLITHVGLNTFVDPRQSGGKCNKSAEDDIVDVIVIDGKEYLHYKPIQVDVGIIRGTFVDDQGNVSTVREAADLDSNAIALNAHNSGGKVIVQAIEVVDREQMHARHVRVPGVLVDAILKVSDQKQTYADVYNPRISGEEKKISEAKAEDVALSLRTVIAKRASKEIRDNDSMNLGFGVPSTITGVLNQMPDKPKVWMSVEQGLHNGVFLDGALFGASEAPDAIVSSTDQFDFYSGGGIDIAFLGMGEMDGNGNVNVSRLNGKIIGPGGFIDIAQNAKRLVFCGTFEAKGFEIDIKSHGLHIRKHGEITKLVDKVEEITFSGDYARSVGQEVLYVTERAVFKLVEGGVELIEIAEGVDLQKDILERMKFRPVINDPVIMGKDYFDSAIAAVG